jgi:hypothetical protein
VVIASRRDSGVTVLELPKMVARITRAADL